MRSLFSVLRGLVAEPKYLKLYAEILLSASSFVEQGMYSRVLFHISL